MKNSNVIIWDRTSDRNGKEGSMEMTDKQRKRQTAGAQDLNTLPASDNM
jgi:hypothetical protein